MSDDCALCERPMNPGQRRAETEDGRKAHSSCVAIANTKMGFPELEEIGRVLDAVGRDHVAEWLVGAVADQSVRDAIRDAALDVFPTKSTQLRRMMLSTADKLDRIVTEEAKASSFDQKLGPARVAAIVQAATVLRTVGIYVSDDPA